MQKFWDLLSPREQDLQKKMTSLPANSSSSLLGRSFPRRDYRGTASDEDEREGSGGNLVTPVIDDSEVEGEGGRYSSSTRSLDSLGKKRARSAASVLQGHGGDLDEAADDDWFMIPNPHRRKEHLTRCAMNPTHTLSLSLFAPSQRYHPSLSLSLSLSLSFSQ